MEKLEAEIAQLIRQYRAKTGRFLTIGTVESATGGRIADKITNIPGSSDYFRGSIVAYSNEVKITVVGVRRATMESHGAVSEQVALEMARGGRKILNADICISDTGIAGPSGATPEKPVGLFYLGLASKEHEVVHKYLFQGNREENKEDACRAALQMLRRFLSQHVDSLPSASEEKTA
jgi:PncC family amidohydrolase